MVQGDKTLRCGSLTALHDGYSIHAMSMKLIIAVLAGLSLIAFGGIKFKKSKAHG
jgi:hypothetical protein